MQISERVRTMKPSLTLSVNTRAMELRAQGIQVTSLAVGEPDFPTPKHICEAAKAAIDANFCRYTAVPGIPELRAAVGGYFKKFYGEDIAPECTIVSAGGRDDFPQGLLQQQLADDELYFEQTLFWSKKDRLSATAQLFLDFYLAAAKTDRL